MIALLDANTLMQDPMCNGIVWRVLAHAPESWELRIVTSEVAVAEAVAGYERQVAEEVRHLAKVTKSWGRIGANVEAEALRKTIEQKSHKYRTYLGDSLAAAGAEVLPPPAVPHMHVVARSVARKRPCDKDGNGYRDTLIWLTVLRLAEEYREEQIVLVTADSDFMDDEKAGFHSDLLEDLAGIAADGRVRLMNVLSDIAVELAAERTSDRENLGSLREELRDETVRTYLRSLVGAVLETTLDARRCALPRLSTANLVRSVGPLRDVNYEIKGGVAEGEAVADFTFEADTQIVLTLPEGMRLEESDKVRRLPGLGPGSAYVITKALRFSGIVQFGRYDRPLGGEITRIIARSDDPGRDETLMGNFIAGLKVDPLAELRAALKVDPLAELRAALKVDPLAELIAGLKVDPLAELIAGLKVDPLAELRAALKVDPLAGLMSGLKVNPMADRPKEDPHGAEGAEEASDDGAPEEGDS